MLETWVQPLGRKDPLEKEMATLSSILACDRACVQYQEVFLSPLFCLNVLVSFSYEPCRQASPAPLVNMMAAQSVLWTLWFKKERCFFPPIKSLKKKKKREGKNSLSNACSQGIGALLSEWTWIKEAEFGDWQPHENYLAEWGRGSEAVLLGRHNDSCHQERKGGREKRVITKSHCPYELPRISSFNQPPSCLRSVWPSTLFHHLGLLRIVLFHACFHSTVIKIILFHCLKYLSLETN